MSYFPVKPGTLEDFGGGSVKPGYLLCDGTSYPTASYPRLFASVGYTWGGAGANFNVPDFRRRASIGSGGVAVSGPGNAVGNSGGEELHTLNTGEIPGHTHSGGTSSNATGVYDSGHTHHQLGELGGTGSGGFELSISDTTVQGATVQQANANIQDPTHSHTFTTDNGTGGNGAHNNMQPSAVVTKIVKF